MSFLGEIKRRKIFQVAAVYAVVAWLLVQVIVAIEAPLNLPGWFDTAVIVLLMVGFPITIIISWAFNLTAEGLVSDKGGTHADRIGGRRVEYVLVALLVVAVGWIGYRELGPSGEAELQLLPNSVAVLPFENLSPDIDDQYFALGMHQAISDQLRKLNGLNAISRTTMMRYADSTQSIREIAEELGVDSVMEGSVRYSENAVVVSVQLIDPETDTDLWSASYDADMENISTVFEVQANIATNVASALEAQMSLQEQRRLGRNPTTSSEAYEYYLEGLAADGSLSPDGSERALAAFDKAIDIDPSFALAWAKLSGALSIAPTWRPERTLEYQDRAYATALRALELEPDLPEPHIAMSFISTIRGDWLRSVEEHELAIELGANPAEMPEWSVLELAVGHMEQARSTLAANQVVNPLNSTGLAFLLAANEALGDSTAVQAGYEQGKTFEQDWYFGEFIMNAIRLGRGELEELRGDDEARPTLQIEFGDYDSTASALDALRSRYASAESNDHNGKMAIAAWAAFYGDQDLALSAAADSVGQRAQNIWLLWLPVFDELRRTVGFRNLVEEHGLVEYWQRFGWPEFCSPTEGAEFECS